AKGADQAFNEVQLILQDATEVHRVVMVSRSWDLVNLIGTDQAHTLLRQSVHYCIKNEPWSAKYAAGQRTLLPKLLDQHKLLGKKPARREVDDAGVDRLSETFFKASPDQAADGAAAALAEGIHPE